MSQVTWKWLGFLHAPGNDPNFDWTPLLTYFQGRDWTYFATREVGETGVHHIQFILNCPLTVQQKRVVYNKFATINRGRKRYGLRAVTYTPDFTLAYCCKGSSHGAPPDSCWNNFGYDVSEIPAAHEVWWASKSAGRGTTVNVTHISGGAATARKPTVFSQLLDYFETYTEEHGEPSYKVIVDKVMSTYNNDRRLAGTGVRRRAIQEMCMRFNEQLKRTIVNNVLDEDSLLMKY